MSPAVCVRLLNVSILKNSIKVLPAIKKLFSFLIFLIFLAIFIDFITLKTLNKSSYGLYFLTHTQIYSENKSRE